MGNSTQYTLPPVSVKAASDVKITKLSLLIIGTEYSHVLQSGVSQLELYPKLGSEIYFRFSSSGEYKTIPRGNAYNLAGINFIGKTVYIIGSSIDDIEITEYY